ncbi:glycosyltransferase family 4 protein [Chloroflexota bacterium]
MRILQVTSFFSPSRGGGGIAVAYQLSKSLAQRGHEVTVYTSDFELDQEYINTIQSHGVRVNTFRSWLNLVTLHITPGMIKELKKQLGEYDIIHFHNTRTFQNIVLSNYAKAYGIPYIIDAHGLNTVVGRRILKWFFDSAFGDKILKNASRVIAETELGVNEYRDFGIDEHRIIRLFPPVDTEQFSKLPTPGLFRDKFNIKEKHIIMYLGRIHQGKGLGFIVESFYQLAQQNSDVFLVIVGSDDGYQVALANEINNLKLSDRTLFTGFLAGEEKLSALVDADVMVVPSKYEQGLAWASLEAVMCDTPIIVSKDTGAGEDVVRMGGGYLVEYGDKKELANTIQWILNNPVEATSNTEKAKEYIKANLSISKKIEDYEKIYLECIAESQGL